MGQFYPNDRRTIILDLDPTEWRTRVKPVPHVDIPPVRTGGNMPPIPPNNAALALQDLPPFVGKMTIKMLRRHIIAQIAEVGVYVLQQYIPGVAAQPAAWFEPDWPNAWAGAVKYICPNPDNGGEVVTAGTTYAITPGVSSANCIGGQAIAPGVGTNLRIGFWQKTNPGIDRYHHLRSYVRNAGSFGDVRPAYIPAVAAVPAVAAKFAPFPKPRPAPNLALDVSVEYGRPKPEPLPRPPPKRTKEKKIAVAIDGRSRLGRIVNIVGELPDIIDCFEQALPKKYRPGRKPMVDFATGNKYTRKASAVEKAEAVYEHLDSIDLGSVLMCLAANQAEDAFFGAVGRVTARANRRMRKRGGFQLGPAI